MCGKHHPWFLQRIFYLHNGKSLIYKYVLSGNFDVQFDYIIGDGTETGLYEYIYLDAIATDEGVSGQYIRSYVRISPLTSYSYIFSSSPGL